MAQPEILSVVFLIASRSAGHIAHGQTISTPTITSFPLLFGLQQVVAPCSPPFTCPSLSLLNPATFPQLMPIVPVLWVCSLGFFFTVLGCLHGACLYSLETLALTGRQRRNCWVRRMCEVGSHERMGSHADRSGEGRFFISPIAFIIISLCPPTELHPLDH